MRRPHLLINAALTATATAAVVGAASTPQALAEPSAGETLGYFSPVDPTRVLDTRTTGRPVGPGGTLAVTLPPQVPSTAVAAVLTVTVTAPTADGYLTVFPGGSARPLASSLNKRAGETRSNAVTATLPSDGSGVVDVYNQAGTSDVVVDLLGWYDPAPGASYKAYDTPIRFSDSREDTGPLGPGDVVNVAGPAPIGIAPVVAAAVNITAVDPGGPGYLTAWDGRDAQPGTSTVNFGTDPVTPAFAIVPAYEDDDGVHFAVADNVSTTDVVVDVIGVYAPVAADEGVGYLPVTPTRLSDTRLTGILGPNQSYATAVPAGAPDRTVGVNLNVTGVDAREQTFLTLWSYDKPRPLTSSLNPLPGRVLANAVPVRLNSRLYSTYNALGFVDVVADLQGYFVASDP